MGKSVPTNTMSVTQQNLVARNMVLSQAILREQQIYSKTITSPGSSDNIVNISPNYAGLAVRFRVEVSATIANTDSTNAFTLTDFGPWNLLSNVTFTDLNNVQRINTSGRHLAALSCVKSGRTFGAAVTNDSPVMGHGWTNIIQAPSTIASGGSNTATLNMIYDVPLAYHPTQDLRGAIFMSVVNATADLQLTINPTPITLSGADSLNSVYSTANSSAIDGSITSITIKVYQLFYDQLPKGKNTSYYSGYTLPVQDLMTIYELKNSTVSSITANTDYPIAYGNFRQFLSTWAIYNQNGTRANGSDVNYWSVLAASFVPIWKRDPIICALMSRNQVAQDFPAGAYYFDHRFNPIETTQQGNMQLILNASSAATDSSVEVNYEDFALQNLVMNIGSLA